MTTSFEAFSLGGGRALHFLYNKVRLVFWPRDIFFLSTLELEGMMIHKSWKVAKVQISDVSYL